MGREEKMKFLKYLDSKGAFLISKSSEKVCEFLGISKYTLYNYLETVRSEGAARRRGVPERRAQAGNGLERSGLTARRA